MPVGEVGVGGRQRNDDPVGQLQPALLAQSVQRVDEVVRPPFLPELVVDLEVEPDGEALRVRPAALLRTLDQ